MKKLLLSFFAIISWLVLSSFQYDDFETLKTSIIFGAVIEVIVSIILIVLFVKLCDDVKALRRRFALKDRNFKKDFAFYVSIGEMGKAKELLEQELANDVEYEAAIYNIPGYRQKILTEYKYYIDNLSIKIDFDAALKALIPVGKRDEEHKYAIGDIIYNIDDQRPRVIVDLKPNKVYVYYYMDIYKLLNRFEGEERVFTDIKKENKENKEPLIS
jgi:hypothetical protein